MAIKVEFITKRSKEYEQRVSTILKELEIENWITGELSIYDARRIFLQEIKTIPRMSAFYAEYCYKAGEVEKKQFTVYHLTSTGDIDRTLAIVKQVN